ncbi:hypothetical protein C4J81_09600 [Deltaproteobacteria bacterium Smac51]|nr:hypothetical protein C4J81_09600 [Deltaproteobacteria bacterium Smac51]
MEIPPNNVDANTSTASSRMTKRVRPRVMVVDDDPIIGCVLAGALNRGGFDVETFNNGIEALESFDHLELDMVVADWIMPGLDGISLIDALKDKDPDLPAMLITSYVQDERVQSACDRGRIDAVLSKPFNLKKFLGTVSYFLGMNDSAEPLSPASRPLDEAAQIAARIEKLKSDSVDGWKAMVGRESFFEQIHQSVIDAIIMVDRDGRIIHYNRGAARMFGFQPNQAGNLMLSDYCPVGSLLPSTLMQFFQPHPPVEEQSESFFRRANGEEFYTVFSVSLFEPDHQEPAVLLVVKDINDRHTMERRIAEKNRNLELMAITDPLTGLYNRRFFDHKLAEEFRRVERYQSSLSLIMIDFDHFKIINDTFGHLAGDKVLSFAASELTNGLRDVDTLARWGGEEFMVLLPETGEEMAVMVARRLHSLISTSKKWRTIAKGLEVTASLGLVSLPWTSAKMTLTNVIEALDKSLYQAKENGRNRIIRYLDTTNTFEAV